MRRVKRLGDLARNRQSLGHRQWAAREAIGERGPFDQFEDQRRHAIGFLQPINCADVRVIQRGEQTRFARETGLDARGLT